MRVPTIFVSYRRDDAIANAGRLFDWLVRQFGRQHVFLDTQSIAPGEQFPATLVERLAHADVLLAVIGPRWASITDAAGQRRLDDPNDFVRLEVSTGLARGIRTIPLLVGGAPMPNLAQLPAELASLCALNALPIDDLHFEQDFDNLVDAILGRQRGFARRELDRLRRLLLVAKASSLIAPLVALILLFAVWMQLFDFFALDTKVSSYSMLLGEQFTRKTQDAPVVLITVDEATETRLGAYSPSAMWRTRHADLIARLTQGGAKRVVFDLFFEQELDGDADMASQIRAANTVGTQVVLGVRSITDAKPVLAPKLQAAAAGWGVLCLTRRLGYIYAVPLAVAQGGSAQSFFPAVSPALALVALNGQVDRMEIDAERMALKIASNPMGIPALYGFSSVDTIRFPQRECGTFAEGDTVVSLLLPVSPARYWRDPRRRVSYAEALELPADALRAKVHNKIALVGVTLERGHDLYSVVRGLHRENVFGVELQADAIATLAAGTTARPPGVTAQWSWMVALFLAGATASFGLHGRSRLLRALLMASILPLYLLLAVVFYAAFGWLLNALYDLAAFAGGYLILGRLQRLGAMSADKEDLT
jgi:CHASE2 domain-containing sensor protein